MSDVYKCVECGFEKAYPKRRVKCEECKKFSMTLKVETSQQPEEKKGPKNPRQAFFNENTFVDDGSKFASERELTKKLNEAFKPSNRERGEFKPLMRTCQACNKEYRVFGAETKCNDCLLNMR